MRPVMNLNYWRAYPNESDISVLLRAARRFVVSEPEEALTYLRWALDYARQLPCDVPRNRCLRAYIVQAMEALNHAHT